MIFNLFKSKPTLKELIPEGFVDIHSHILPGIDDGAKNISESQLLISEMKNIGFSKIIATPHTYPGLYENTNNSISSSFINLKKNIETDIDISYASEYLIGEYLVERAEERSILTIKDNYVLTEMSYIGISSSLEEVIFKLVVNGYTPILAHPERYIYLHDDYKKYHMLKSRGCKFQINLLSLVGHHGKNVLRISEKLLSDNMIDFVGSDIHNSNDVMKICKSKLNSRKVLKKVNEAIANTNKNFL